VSLLLDSRIDALTSFLLNRSADFLLRWRIRPTVGLIVKSKPVVAAMHKQKHETHKMNQE